MIRCRLVPGPWTLEVKNKKTKKNCTAVMANTFCTYVNYVRIAVVLNFILCVKLCVSIETHYEIYIFRAVAYVELKIKYNA